VSATFPSTSHVQRLPPTPPATPKPTGPRRRCLMSIRFIWRTNNGLGITVGDLSTAACRDTSARKMAYLVTSVADNSAASKAGSQGGRRDYVFQRLPK
jgi:hypothetical protein